MFKIIAIAIFACVLFVRNGESAPTALQVLPEREGYIPVYIRNGNTPLVDINPELAEAFRETNNVQTREAKAEEPKFAADQTLLETKPIEEKPTVTETEPSKASGETPEAFSVPATEAETQKSENVANQQKESDKETPQVTTSNLSRRKRLSEESEASTATPAKEVTDEIKTVEHAEEKELTQSTDEKPAGEPTDGNEKPAQQ